jgi:3-oxoacyl-[acyl-carrier protein] reductase
MPTGTRGGAASDSACGSSDGASSPGDWAKTPRGRIGQPHDIAPTVAFQVSDDSGWMTGETLRVAGGLR